MADAALTEAALRIGGAAGSAEPRAAAGEDGPPETRPSEADLLDDMGDEIARLAAHIHAATRRYLDLVAEFDRREGWKPSGHTSCARWLSHRTGHNLRTAREHVRVARALEELPQIDAAMARGRLSFSQARALTRVATPETEAELLELAEGCPTAVLERKVRAWRKGSREDEAARERERHRSRRLSVVPDDDGMYVIRGRLTPEVGAVLRRALEAAEDALYRRERSAGGEAGDEPAAGSAEPGCSPEPPSPRQARREARRRRADAMGLLAERALTAGFGGGDGADDVPVSGARAERYQVFLHVDASTLEDRDGEEGEPGRSELEDGTRVAAETARRLSCDAAAVRVDRDPNGSVLDVGRRTRTVPPALRRALEVRDRGCRFPGCGLRFTDAHHVVHWADGGETSLENTMLLCRRHHRLVHEEGWSVEWWGERAVFRDPRGRFHTDTGWKAPELPEDPVRSLERENRLDGADPGPLDAAARWKRERAVPDDVWFPAVEAGMAPAAPP
jgi:hypothetical protein